ncbi:MAG: Xaa-Pro peptidase family protein [Pseudomonadota bacterium]
MKQSEEKKLKKNSARVDKALSLMKERGLNGLMVYSNGTCSMLRPSYFHYFAGLRPIGRNQAVVLSKSGDAVLLLEPAWDAARGARKSWISDVRGSTDFIHDLVGVIRGLNLTGSLGVVAMNDMTDELHAAVIAECKFQPADDVVEELARVKTKQEIEHVKKVARIADIGFKAFLEYGRVGIREYELSAEMEYAMRKAGADDNFTLLSSGKHNFAMHTPTDKRLEPGDLVLGEITPLCEGQFIQLCRTIVLGKPDPAVVEKYDMLLRSFDEALKPVKSGNPAALISRNMNKVISEAGYAEYCYPPYMRARGHGLGVGSIAPGGTIDDQTKTMLESQQVIIVHPNQYLPETGYLACGETVMVTDIGLERLVETETKLYIK